LAIVEVGWDRRRNRDGQGVRPSPPHRPEGGQWGVEFFADNPRLGTDTLWFSDGTAAGTNELLDGFADPSFLALATNSAEVHSDILWQNANGQASIWETNGNSLVGGGP
jgi:hypothetical protein